MAPRTHSVESGLGSEESGSDSAMRDFFQSYMPQLEMAYRNDGDDFDMDDPTLDLDDHALDKGLAIRPPSPITRQQQPTFNQRLTNNGRTKQVARQTNNNQQVNNTFRVVQKKDPNLEELEFIVGELKKKSHYSDKLTDIMLKGLEKTLAGEVYQVFLKNQLPENWMPIVRMNNDNTPYVEFLIKSDVADQDPGSQLSDFTMKHIAFSKFIVDFLCDSAIKPQNNPTLQTTRPLQLKSRQSVQSQKTHQHAVHAKPIGCSTPLSQRKRSSLIVSNKNDLNDSKRILPSRACKANLSGIYSK